MNEKILLRTTTTNNDDDGDVVLPEIIQILGESLSSARLSAFKYFMANKIRRTDVCRNNNKKSKNTVNTSSSIE